MIRVDHDDPNANYKYPLNTDLIMSQNLPRSINDKEKEGWKPFFFPKDFVKINFALKLENFVL